MCCSCCWICFELCRSVSLFLSLSFHSFATLLKWCVVGCGQFLLEYGICLPTLSKADFKKIKNNRMPTKKCNIWMLFVCIGVYTKTTGVRCFAWIHVNSTVLRIWILRFEHHTLFRDCVGQFARIRIVFNSFSFTSEGNECKYICMFALYVRGFTNKYYTNSLTTFWIIETCMNFVIHHRFIWNFSVNFFFIGLHLISDLFKYPRGSLIKSQKWENIERKSANILLFIDLSNSICFCLA